jgi:hypothetical protein
MAIYLDANTLWSWRTFTETDRLAVSIVAHQLGQQVYVPWIAAREAEEEYRRSLQSSIDELHRAHAAIERRFATSYELMLEPWPQVGDQLMTWRRRLSELAFTLPMKDRDARTALEREITGAAPAAPRQPGKPGRGGRDAAIWLSIARHHVSLAESGHLLSADKAFSIESGTLNGDLVGDLNDHAYEIRVYSDIATFLARLGAPAPAREISLTQLGEVALPAVREALKDSLEVPIALWETLATELRYRTRVVEGRPVDVVEQRRYEQTDAAVIVVNVRWDLIVDAAYQEKETDTPDLWSVIGDLTVRGHVQLFLEERAGELHAAEVIGAQLTSKTHLFFAKDGTVMSLEPADDSES